MKDGFNREINYLRISVTDKCNLHCKYCMGFSDAATGLSDEELSLSEIVDSVRACAVLGVKKVRITGGEPLVRKDILSICERVSNIDGIEEVCLTTNGTLLSEYANYLKAVGVKRINISLDTLSADKYIKITGNDAFYRVLAGIEKVVSLDFEGVKLNGVLMKGINDDEIRNLAELTLKYPVDFRFIELMPMTTKPSGRFGEYIEGSRVLDVLPELVRENDCSKSQDVSLYYRFPGALGRVGIITPVSRSFCASCNRIRITYDGFVKPCLHSKEEFKIKGLDYLSKVETLRRAISSKPEAHIDFRGGQTSEAARAMNRIGG